MKRTRRFVVREQTFGLVVEFYCGTPQASAIRRCANILQLDPKDPDNQPDDNAPADCTPVGAGVNRCHIGVTLCIKRQLKPRYLSAP
jgi:hypothetical protein